MKKSQIATSFFSLFRGFKQSMQQELKTMDVDITILHFITLKEIGAVQPCTAQLLTEVMGLDKAQISRILKELINKALIRKEANPEDKRSQLLFVTTKGRRYLEWFNQAEERLATIMIKQIKSAEVKQWVTVTQQMTNNLSELN